MKKLLKFAAAVLFIYILASAGAAWFATSQFKPSMPYNTAALGFEVEDVTITTSDKLQLRGWYSQGPAGSPAVALFHGSRATRSQTLPIARALTLSGYDLLMIDMRGCGQSAGGSQGLGTKESADVAAAVRFLQNERPHAARRVGIVALGTSASAAILSHAEVAPLGACALLAPYSSLDGAIDDRFRNFFGRNASWASSLTKEIVGWRVGKPVAAVRPGDLIAQLSPCPLLLVGAGDDPLLPPDTLQSIFDAASEPKEIYMIPGASRERLADLGASDLKRRLTVFFDSNLK